MAFDLENFTHRLIAEALFYDYEYGAVGSVSLIDPETRREHFIASFMPDDGTFLIEEATEWEEVVMDEAEDVAYDLAIDSNEYARYDIPEEAAIAVLKIAQNHDLLPSMTVLFEDDEM